MYWMILLWTQCSYSFQWGHHTVCVTGLKCIFIILLLFCHSIQNRYGIYVLGDCVRLFSSAFVQIDRQQFDRWVNFRGYLFDCTSFTFSAVPFANRIRTRWTRLRPTVPLIMKKKEKNIIAYYWRMRIKCVTLKRSKTRIRLYLLQHCALNLVEPHNICRWTFTHYQNNNSIESDAYVG